MLDWRINFGQNLWYLRKTHGLTLRQMAEIVGVSLSTYRKMERCDRKVRIHAGRLCRICNHFNIASDEILYRNWCKMQENKL